MEWTYSVYSGVNYGICLGLVIIIGVLVIVTYCTSKKGAEFVLDRIIGVDPNKAEDEENEEDPLDNNLENGQTDNGKKDDVNNEQKVNEKKSVEKGQKISVKVIGAYFCFLAITTLSITAVLIFQGCILFNTRVLPDTDCPEYPLDCFVFNGTSRQPINESLTFRCDPNNNTQFPSGLTDPVALCFGWIIQLQTTKNVLDQLGVCTGLLGLFTALLAVIVYLGKSILTIILCIIFLACCLAAIGLLIFFKWSFSPLTYAVLILGAALAIFGLVLCYIIPKRKKPPLHQETIQSNPVENNVPSLADVSSSPQPSIPTRISAHRTKLLERSAKVTPQ